MIKNKLILVIAILYSSSIEAQSSCKIILLYSDLYAETVFRIDCKVYGQRKILDYNEIVFTSKSVLNHIALLVKKGVKQTKPYRPDVRGKLIILYNKKKVEYCFDKGGKFESKGILYENKDLLKYLIKLNP